LFLIQENQTAIKAIQGDNDSGELPPPDPGDTVVLNDLGDVTLTSPTNGQILQYNGTDWVNVDETDTLAELDDTTITSPVSGNILEHDGTDWKNIAWHQPDWAETTSTDPSFIQNKPNIQNAQVFLGTRDCVANGPAGTESANDIYENTAVGVLDSGWGLGASVATGPGCKLALAADGTNWQHLTVGVSSITAGTAIEVTGNAVNPTVGVEDGGIGTNQLADDSVTADKIADDAVGDDQLSTAYIKADGTVNFTGNQGSTATGSFQIATGTTTERNATPANGMIRYNTTLDRYEGYSESDWGALGGGATGGGTDRVFQLNTMVCRTNFALPGGGTPGDTDDTRESALSAGPIIINDGVTITIPNNQNWVIL